MEQQVSHLDDSALHIMNVQDFQNLELKIRLQASHNFFNSSNPKYRDKLPVILIKHPQSKMTQMQRFRIVVKKDSQLLELLNTIRRDLAAGMPEHAVYMFSHSTKGLLMAQSTFNEIYSKHKSEDGFLYLSYAEQESFARA